MKYMFFAGAIIATALITPASAATVMVSLGSSNELFTLYGLGPSASNPALGTFAVGQGDSVYDAVTDRSTFTLSGAIAGGTAGYDSGTYSFVTSYAGKATPLAGPNEPLARSNPNDTNFFNYAFIDPSTDITLALNLAGGTITQKLFASDNFVPGTNFSFLFASATCTGVVVCTQNNVGLTPGATQSGPATIQVSFDVADSAPAVPEPATWAMMIVGFGAIGAALRRKGNSVRSLQAHAVWA